MSCLICGINLVGKPLSNHIRKEHGLSSKDYTIKCILGGVAPSCPKCGNEPRYSTFKFKTYCKEHSKLAMSEGGAKGGAAEAWNKGLKKENDSRLAAYAQRVSGEGNHFFGKKHSYETIDRIRGIKLLDRSEYELRVSSRQEFDCLTPFHEYKGRQTQYLEFKCRLCGKISKKTLQAFERMSRCYICQPDGSKEQYQISEFIKSLGFDVIDNDRTVLDGKEIDIWVPSKLFGIEFNGLYYHSYDEDSKKNRHYEKTELCKKKNIKLMHVFTDEWRDKSFIIKSMIRHRLGVQSEKIFARKCNVQVIDSTTSNLFFNTSHISGTVGACIIHFGLFYNSKIIAAMSFRYPRQKKYKDCVEIARFSTECNVHVIGGLGKLICAAKKYAKECGFKKILTYADLRFGWGDGYTQVGFKSIGQTSLDYWYNDGVSRYNRFKFRSQKGLSESEIAINAGVRKIYGCGSMKYMIDI